MSMASDPTVTASPMEAGLSGEGASSTPSDHDFIPLSFAQQRLWFLDQLEPNSPLYNIRTLARITGRLDTAILKRALNAIVARHEILRTRIVCQDGVPSLKITESGGIDLQCRDWAHPSGTKNVELQQFLRKEMNQPFDLSNDLLVRALLVKVSTDEHLIVVT